jgi:hypothetical protein
MARFETSSLPNPSRGCTLVGEKWAGAHFFVGKA